ncbi:hypothetical protein BaRGS_00033408, partial [Batillaria attramentaria]
DPPPQPKSEEKVLSPDEIMAETKRFVEVSKQIHSFEERNVTKNFNLKKDQLKDVTETHKQLEQHYKKATEKVAKEKADEEYLEAVSEQEVAKKQMDGIAEQKQQLEKEVATLGKEMESLMKLYDEQDAILGRIFNGAYGSELENKLEAEFDAILERKERIMVAKYKWTNARILLQHAVNQLGVACGKWLDLQKVQANNVQAKYFMATEARNNLIAAAQNITSAQRYLNNIKFPYCEPSEIKTLERACQNIYIDMQSTERHQHAYQCYSVTYRRAAALLQWFDSVIKNTIGKDLENAKKELAPKEKALREERLRLIKERMGGDADGITLGDGGDFDGDDDELDPELVAIMKPDKPEGTEGGDTLSPDDTSGPPKAPTPLPLNELAPPPSQDELFGNIEQLKQQHEKEMAEFEKAQETNKARIEQGLQEKLRQRRNRRTRLAAD